MALPLAHIDGKYEIVTKIKEGGMGAVYKVRHRLLDEIRVIKALRSQYKDDNALRSRFIQEARAAIRLRHPNIVQIFDFHIDSEGVGFIVMEFIPGVDLGRLLATGGQLPLPLALELARQSLRALDYLHRKGFVHRDFSPDNLMLSQDVDGGPLIKLIDLGIAKDLASQSDLTASGTFLGKFRYSSPEHFGSEGPGIIEARSDLYCFGLVLYQLLTGKFPFAAESTSQFIAAHLFNPPHSFEVTDPEGRIPDSLRRLTLSLLAKKAQERPGSAKEVSQQILLVQKDLPPMEDSWEALSALIAEEGAQLPVASNPGSTQNRLNIGFQPERTPVPGPSHGLSIASQEALPRPVAKLSKPFNQHLSAALAHSDEGEFSKALLELEKAQVLQPRNRTLAPLIAEARAGRKQQKAAAKEKAQEERHQAAIEEIRRRVQDLLTAGRLTDAQQHLHAATERLGRDPVLKALQETVVEAKSKKLASLVQGAGLAWEAGELGTVIEALEEALELDPENAWLRSRLAKARAKTNELGSNQGDANTADTDLTSSDRSDTARVRADQTAEDPHLTLRIPTAQPTAAIGKVGANEFLRQAEGAMQEEDFLKARLLVSEALTASPDHPEGNALAAELDRISTVVTLPDAVGLVILETQTRRLQEGPLAAWKGLQKAMQCLPSSGRLDTLLAELAKEVLEGSP